jgi:hypothetical protein|tara:strand:+ start:432 stop:851 length:420 start_codon:yes stop_codon:yes gene_type:complete
MKLTILQLIQILITIESGGDDNAIGDNGRAYGCLQIHKTMVDDYNRITGNSYTHRDAFNRTKSIDMAFAVLTHYSNHIYKTQGRKANTRDLCRIWNGGGSAWRKQKPSKEEKLHKYYLKVCVEVLKRYNENRTNKYIRT